MAGIVTTTMMVKIIDIIVIVVAVVVVDDDTGARNADEGLGGCGLGGGTDGCSVLFAGRFVVSRRCCRGRLTQ